MSLINSLNLNNSMHRFFQIVRSVWRNLLPEEAHWLYKNWEESLRLKEECGDPQQQQNLDLRARCYRDRQGAQGVPLRGGIHQGNIPGRLCDQQERAGVWEGISHTFAIPSTWGFERPGDHHRAGAVHIFLSQGLM